MIEILTKSGAIARLNGVQDLSEDQLDFSSIQFIDYGPEEVEWAKARFQLDFAIMNKTEDIEVSSHFQELAHQVALHFSLPYFAKKNRMVEEAIFLVFTADQLFVFLSSSLDAYFSATAVSRFEQRKMALNSVTDLLQLFIELVADHYADSTEALAKKVKSLAARVLVKKEFTESDLDLITLLNFNNLLVKESMNEFIRILNLLKKSERLGGMNLRTRVDTELSDLAAVSEYIQFNFDRLDDLKENISNKIDLEQNKIFKILTIVTSCIAMPTLIAGIYGMNFEHMPELKWKFGYPLAVSAMVFSFILPIIYFRIKKWL